MALNCRIHHTPLVCPACLGAAGGKATSEAKRTAARANGARGGRPCTAHGVTRCAICRAKRTRTGA